MKIFNKLLIALLVTFTVTSCSNDFFDVNESIDAPSSATPQLSLPVAQKYTVDQMFGGYNSFNTLGNLWAYTWAAGGDYVYFIDETRYIMASSFRPTTFQNTYLLPLNNYYVIAKNDEPQYANYKAIAKIMMAYHFQYLVDAYGDVPYSEAFQRGGDTTPAYDDAQAIYNDLIVQLNDAQALITAGESDPTVLVPGAVNDVMLQGNMAIWKKFANTLKLRILLRQTNIGVTDYSSVNNGIGFLGAGENVFCNPGYINDTNKQNPFYGAFGKTVAGDPAANANATRVTPFALGLVPTTDPRRPFLFKPGSAGYAGIEQNNVGGPTSATRAGIGTAVLSSSSQNAIIMQAAESLFLQAEAAQRGFISGNPQALYAAGIQESFDLLGAPLGTYDTTLPAGAEIENIIKQKFIALMHTNGFENYTEFRRTGFPAVPAAPDATQPTIPVRLMYPTSEYSANPDNVPAQTTSDAFNTKIFWDN
jgi:hypothetical protein